MDEAEVRNMQVYMLQIAFNLQAEQFNACRNIHKALQKGKYEEAVELREAIALDPTNHVYFFSIREVTFAKLENYGIIKKCQI